MNKEINGIDKVNEEDRGFLGVWIPAEIWLCEELSLKDKVILTEINSLSSTKRGCFASNQYFADFFDTSERPGTTTG